MTSKQPRLFDTDPEPWELDSQEDRPIASVVFAKGLDGVFDYVVPESLLDRLAVGMRVVVPLGRGNHRRTGYCVAVGRHRGAGRRLKEILDVVDNVSLLSPKMLELTRWIADYYLCNWGQVLEAVVPVAVRNQAGTRAVNLYDLAEEVRARLEAVLPNLPPKQRRVVETLAASPEPLASDELQRLAGCSAGPIRALVGRGILVCEQERRFRPTTVKPQGREEDDLTLNTDQRRALDAILDALHSGEHRTVLIHGVTGSGKTEVYLQAIREVISYGKQAIVLVPEISLTPQTVKRFEARFGRVAVLHSKLTDAERHYQWQQIAEGRVPVVIGARSAVFAPVPRLGLIVLDEEHESTFKQETVPRYHAREVAAKRAQLERVPLVLGSATPSLESWFRAKRQRAVMVAMPQRISKLPMPEVEVIDLRDRRHRVGTRAAITPRLSQAIDEAISAGGQVILLLNRRGYATHIQCPGCGFVVRCPDCEIALTHHRTEDVAVCHYCDYTVPAPMDCPECRFEGIRYSGIGTQRVEAELRARFPNYVCLRMDTDTMRGPNSHEQALQRFRSGEVQILLGTQMIAKGLDFPSVTLVGVINADTALHLPDFRAAERTFQLVTQVAGRSGRGSRGGRVLVQTYNPDHPAIQAAARHDYETFVKNELPLRRALGFPPFSHVIRFIVRGEVPDQVQATAAELTRRFREACEQVENEQYRQSIRILGPAPAPIAKLRGKYRYHVQVMGVLSAIHQAARAAIRGFRNPDGVDWVVDVDPGSVL
ncbi:MAG: primosomal protein N' [Planctomycetota bacterium]|nr:MAG: primosomal protein N' [Planctomycetota bacterium]